MKVGLKSGETMVEEEQEPSHKAVFGHFQVTNFFFFDEFRHSTKSNNLVSSRSERKQKNSLLLQLENGFPDIEK